MKKAPLHATLQGGFPFFEHRYRDAMFAR